MEKKENKKKLTEMKINLRHVKWTKGGVWFRFVNDDDDGSNDGVYLKIKLIVKFN